MISFPWSVGYAELYDICTNWHGGQTSAMYSVSSTGTIHDLDTLRGLTSELRHCVKLCKVDSHDDLENMEKWLKWTDDQLDMHDAINGDL
jgi:hypothetical protein